MEAGKKPRIFAGKLLDWTERAAVEAIERGCEVTRLLLKARVWLDAEATRYAAAAATAIDGEREQTTTKKTVAFTSTSLFIPSSSSSSPLSM